MDEVAEKVEAPAESPAQFLGGEIHISIDPSTGRMNVQAPSNKVIAFGMLELAKSIIASQPVVQPRPAIIPANPGQISKLARQH